MKRVRYLRALVRLLVYGLIGVGCLLVTSIWWLPPALPALLKMNSVEVAAVTRQDSGRLLLSEVVYLNESVRFSVESVETPSLHHYLWERLRGDFSAASLLKVDSLLVELQSNGNESPSASQSDVVTVTSEVRAALAAYRLWIPPLEVDAVAVHSARGALLFTAHSVSLRNLQLDARVADSWLLDEVEVRASFSSDTQWSACLAAPDTGLGLNLSLDFTEEALTLEYELQQKSERAHGVILFTTGAWMPAQATLHSKYFTLDPKWLPAMKSSRLEGAELSDVEIQWENGRYAGGLALSGTAVTNDQPSIALEGALEFFGDLERLRIDVLRFEADWGQLYLRQPVEIVLKDGSVTDRAELQVSVELSKQSFLPLSGGRAEVSMRVAPSLAAGPNVHFKLSATDVVYDEYLVAQVDLAGRMEGSVLSVDQLKIQPDGTTTDVVELRGMVDIPERHLDFNYSCALTSDWIHPIVAPLVLSNGLNTSGRVTGRFERPIFEGSLEPLTVEYSEVAPIVFAGDYKGDGWHQWTIAGTASAAGAVIDASFMATVESGLVAVDLDQFIWTDPERPTLTLQEPTRFTYNYSSTVDYPESRFIVEPFCMSGQELQMQGAWDPSIGLELNVRNVSLQRFGRWVSWELPQLTIDSAVLSVSELRPYMIGTVGVHLEMRAADDAAPLRLDAEARLAADGVVANQLELKFAGARLLEGSATVPLIFQLPIGGEPIWRLLDSGALLAQLEGVVTPDFSEWLHRSSGIQISDAALDLKVAGTIERPTGLLEMKVPSVVLAAAKVPVIEQIEIYAKAETDQLQLERFRFAVNQSEVSGSLSLPTAGLVKALTGSMGDYQSWLAQGTGQLELNNWRAEDWVDLLPPLLRRSGRFTGAVALKPEWDLSGRLVFEEFALRPTESAPLIDLIAGEVTLEKRKFTVVNASAQVGGSPVSIDGWFDVNDFGSPLWEFAVIGKNVPLVRTTDMILRSDLDVKASHTTRSETPLIRGVLNLRSSTMLVEFDPLTPDVNAGGRSKPPFFSISDPAFAEWRFDLKISGDTFMRVRSPYFKTQLSANFDLGGTFAEPLLVGSARTVAGELRFPGAKMPITSGEAYIERGRPNDVQLNFNGIAHKASYVITMDVSQTLADPQVQFQSTPALSNAAIVRLLTTGSTTGGGAGTVGLYLGQGLLGASGMDDQLADRLTVDVGEANSRSGRNTVDVRYDLSEDFSLEGAYDVYDAYNLDFSWSIFKR